MSERKVLNKYYPPDFDPSKIPRMKLPKNRQYTVRLMAPFNMRCKTCGEYIYKGKKFNARKEDVENEDYLGIRIYRFYIKCTRCLQEISFKTDPKNTDYEIEAGATRNFMALKLAEEQAQKEEEEAKEEEANNPMKLLENRTKQSKNEIELLESLEELKDLNKRQQIVDFDTMLSGYDTRLSQQEREERLKQLDEEYIKSIKFNNPNKRKLVIEEEIIEESTSGSSPIKHVKLDLPSISTSSWSLNNKSKINLVKKPFTNLIKLKSNERPTEVDKDKVVTSKFVVNDKPTASPSSWSLNNKSKTINPKKPLVSFVKVKSNTKQREVTEEKVMSPVVSSSSSKNPVNSSNALSLLGAYSDSDSNADE